MWIYYWLAANGIHPFNDVKSIVVPPPQMVANMRVGNMDGFCVGEPWNNRAISTRSASPRRPRKRSGKIIPRSRSARRRNSCRDIRTRARDGGGGSRGVEIHRRAWRIGRRSPKSSPTSLRQLPVEVIDQRLEGNYDNGIGKQWKDPDYMKFYNEGYVNFPFLSDGMWFLTQHKRWGC
jgi:nitrate/nitrite transport system substrate-binding protein